MCSSDLLAKVKQMGAEEKHDVISEDQGGGLLTRLAWGAVYCCGRRNGRGEGEKKANSHNLNVTFVSFYLWLITSTFGFLSSLGTPF